MVSTDVEKHVRAYAAGFNAKDLTFRSNVKSIDEFVTAYMASLREPTSNERSQILTPLIARAVQLTKPFPALAAIPYKFLILTNPELENGMPHTHADTIIIPESVLHKHKLNLTTLLHEQLHVFQRMYPIECHLLYTTKWGYKTSGMRDATLSRSNPDITAIEYADVNGKVFDNAYTSTATGLRDIIDPRDHPHEVFAYRVSEELAKEQTLTDPSVRKLLANPSKM